MSLRALLLSAVVLSVGLGLTWSAANNDEDHLQRVAQARFDQSHDRLLSEVRRRLEQPLFGLRGARGAIAASRDEHATAFDRNAFRRYVASRDLKSEFPGVRGMGFIERVSAVELDAFLTRQREQRAEEFSVHPREAGLEPRYVISVVEPLVFNTAAQGFDVGSEPRRRKAVEHAIDTGKPTLTEPIRLVQDERQSPGFLLMVPVFRVGLPTNSPAERRDALLGLVYAPLIAEELLEGTLAAGDGAVDIDLTADAMTGEEMVYDADHHTQRHAVPRRGRFQRLTTFEFGTVRFHLLCLSSAEFEASVSGDANRIRWLGSLLALALAGLVFALSTSRERALAEAHRMTEELRDGRLKAEAHAKELEALLNALSAHFLVSTTDAAGTILSANAALCELSGYSEAELIGHNHRMLNSGQHPPEFWAEMWATIAADRPWRGDVCNRKKDGTRYWVDSVIAPLPPRAGQSARYISIRKDITARKLAEDELAQQTLRATELAERADDANRAKSSFLANISHEIRTPMNGVLGMTELLLSMDLTPRQDEAARTVYRSADALLSILNDILDFSKIEAGKLEFERLHFDLRQTLYDAADLFRPKVTGRGVELLVRVAPDFPQAVWGDPTRVRQVVLNLVSNAVKFTEHGSVLVELDLTPSGAVRVKVTDTGAGIPPERASVLFKPFTQADASTSRRFGGTGLGLAISRRLAEGMGGTLDFETKLNVGTTFTLELKLEVEALTSPPRLEGVRVLLVEPFPLQRRIVTEQLERAGAVVQAHDHTQELQLSVQPADVVLWAEAVAPAVLPSGVANVVQANVGRGRPGWVTVPRPAPTAVLVRTLSAAARGELEPQRAVALVRPAPELEHLNVLVADDNAINLRVARAMLEGLGCEVTCVSDGAAAVTACASRAWDVVFMDCQMPALDGYEATAAIRAAEQPLGRHTRVVAMTANAGADDRVRCLAAGMDDFISKPCRAADFAAALSRLREARAAVA